MAFSPDGKTLAFMGNLGNSGVMLWNMATSRQTGQPLPGTVRLAVSAMAFSPDGQTLATGGPSGAQLWDVATGQQVGSPLTGSPVNAVTFSPDGRTLATAGPGGTTLWAVASVTSALTHICTQAGGSLTPATWARYIPAGTPYLNPCPPART
jgi:WD40 repeat protein